MVLFHVYKATMSGKELFELYLEGKAGSKLNNLAFLLEMACNWDVKKAESILDECEKTDKKLKAVYPELGETPDEDDKFIGNIYDGALYITSGK